MSDPVGASTSVELIVPSPVSRSPTLKPPKNLSLVLSVCGEALKMYGDQKLSPISILVVLQHIIIVIEKLVKISGEEKKELAIESIHWLISQQKELTDEERTTLDLLAIAVFPQAIDLLAAKLPKSCLDCFSKW
jgi:hypothetical protein